MSTPKNSLWLLEMGTAKHSRINAITELHLIEQGLMSTCSHVDWNIVMVNILKQLEQELILRCGQVDI